MMFDPITLKEAKKYVNRKIGEVAENTENLIDFSALSRFKSISPSTGDLVDNSTNHTTDWIPVVPGKTYTFNGLGRMAWYDENKSFLTSILWDREEHSTIAPANARYMRATIYIDRMMVAQFNEGTSLNPLSGGRRRILPDVVLSSDLRVSRSNIDLFSDRRNILDVRTLIDQHNVNSLTGELFVDGSLFVTPFLDLEPNTQYSGDWSGAYIYDMDGNYRWWISDQTFVSPSFPSQARFVFHVSSLGSANVIKGDPAENDELSYRQWVFTKESGLSPLNRFLTGYALDSPLTGLFQTVETYTHPLPDWNDTTSDDIYGLFDGLASAHPNSIAKEFLGVSSSNQEIAAYHIRPLLPQADVDRPLPRIVIVCGQHGGEKTPTLVTYLMLTQMLGPNSHEYPHLEAIRHNAILTVVPVANPWGWDNYKRKTMQGVDMNRNYPYRWRLGSDSTSEQYGGPEPLSEPETQAIKGLIDRHPDIAVLYDFHHFTGTSSTTDFVWISSASIDLQWDAQRLIAALTRMWRQRYDFVPPEPFFAGYTGSSSGATLANYARYRGIPVATTLEICYRWWLDPEGNIQDQRVIESGMETLVNWIANGLTKVVSPV